MADTASAPTFQASGAAYAGVTAGLAVWGGVLYVASQQRAGELIAGKQLLGPMTAMAGLILLAWLAMVLIRNVTLLRGTASPDYFVDYHSKPPVEWIERPARTFNNLLQLPQLFYVACLTMMITGSADGAQLLLAWLFVLARAVHAVAYIGWNYVPARFGCWHAGLITLIVLWVRMGSLNGVW